MNVCYHNLTTPDAKTPWHENIRRIRIEYSPETRTICYILEHPGGPTILSPYDEYNIICIPDETEGKE